MLEERSGWRFESQTRVSAAGPSVSVASDSLQHIAENFPESNCFKVTLMRAQSADKVVKMSRVLAEMSRMPAKSCKICFYFDSCSPTSLLPTVPVPTLNMSKPINPLSVFWTCPNCPSQLVL